MKNFAAEFCDLSAFYTKLAEDLAKTLDADDAQDSRVLVESTLRHRELLDRVPTMSPSISELTKDWSLCRAELDPAARREAEEKAADAKSQAVRLQELCRIHILKLQAIHDEIRRNLAELAKGARFAKVLKPVQQNYPKFIDSKY